MSKKGVPYDNACAETFYHSFKVETIFDEKFAGNEDLKKAIVNYMEIFTTEDVCIHIWDTKALVNLKKLHKTAILDKKLKNGSANRRR